MKSLRQIFFNELTLGSDKWEPYFDVYETYFSKFVDKAPVVVEVGVQSGGSLQMWRKYFGPEAQLWGIDVDPAVARLQPNYDSNTHIRIGDQADPQFWQAVLQQMPEIDVFIDDGGHQMHQQRVTFECVFPKIRPGGVFLCEDTHSSYMPWLGGGRDRCDTFIEYAKQYVELLHTGFLDKELPEDAALKPFAQQIYSVHFYNSVVVFQKKAAAEQEFKRVIVNK